MKDNPAEILKTATDPKPLTLGKVALFEMIDAPVLRGDIDSLEDNLKAIWCYKTPTAEAAKNISRINELALEMGDSISHEDYQSAILEIIEGVTEFFKMLPRPEEEKKTPVVSATGGSES